MSNSIPVSSQPKKLFPYRNVSGELDVFEASRYFAGATENFSDTRKNISVEAKIFNNTARPLRRMSLDTPTHRGDHIPLQAMLMENRMLNNKEKKCKQPNSPGGKLAHFLNSLFNQRSSKKSKSTKDEHESPGGWRRKRRSSISHFGSGNSTSTSTTTTTTATTATIMSDSKSPFSISASSGFRTPPPCHVTNMPIKTTSYKDPKTYSHLKPPTTQNTKTPINGNLNKIETLKIRSDFYDKTKNFRNGFFDKVKIYDKKQENMKDFKRFIDDDGADSDSSSDLFELSSCNLGSRSSGLPVYETTRMVSTRRGASIST